MHKSLCSWMLVGLAVLAAAGVARAQEEVFPLDEVERGQRGYGLSVFQGTEPERFEFEVIGVWRNVQPDVSYILAEFSGQGLEETGVIAGMSGSPVYLDGRLVGAVSFSWPFSNRAVGGITPIESMRELLDVHRGLTSASLGIEPFDLAAILEGRVDESKLVAALARLEPEPIAGARPGVQWLASGFGAQSRRLLGAGLGELATAGSGVSRMAANELAPGSSVSGVLIDGDFSLAATGTVTDRADRSVLAFGHAFLGLGPLNLPMATSEVVTVISSQYSSFKVANLGPIVGAFDFDHSAGFRGEMGRVAPMVPLKIGLNGRTHREVNVRIASLPQLSSTLLAISVLGALDVDPEAVGSESFQMTANYDLGSAGTLAVRQSFDGPGAGLEMVLHLFAITGFLAQNDFAEVDIAGVDVEFSWQAERQMAELVAAHASRTRVRPGESLEVSVDLKGYRGEIFRRTLELRLPTDLPAGRFSVLFGDGVSIDAARLTLEGAQPTSLAQALDLLGSLHSRRELLALGLFRGAGLAVPGAAMPRLPDSIRSLWGAAPTGDAKPLNLAVSQQLGVELDRPLTGLLRVDLQVEHERPWSGQEKKSNEKGRSD